MGSLCIFSAFALWCYNYRVSQEGAVYCESIRTEFLSMVTVEDPFPMILPAEEEILWEDMPPVVSEVRNEGIWIQGDLYIGLLEVPSLNLALPINMDYSEKKLKNAPCVYLGTLAEGDLVIAGHNYRSHFWYLRNLSVGSRMSITNPNGVVYQYIVDERQILHQSEVAVLKDRAQWDLTLFTCDYPDNNYRVVLRCKRVM